MIDVIKKNYSSMKYTYMKITWKQNWTKVSKTLPLIDFNVVMHRLIGNMFLTITII